MNLSRTAPRPALTDALQPGIHNIGAAAGLRGVSVKMLRHAEGIGLIPAGDRALAGYRIYSDADVHRLQFIKRARVLGFSIVQIKALLSLWSDRSRASSEVKQLAQAHADELAAKIAEMAAMQRTLQDLANRCHGDD